MGARHNTLWMLFFASLALLAPVQDAFPLSPERPAHIKLAYGLGGLASYLVDVPEDKYAMLVRLTDATHNLDLDASLIQEDAYTENYYFAPNPWYDRSLYIPITEPYGLVAGTWQIDVMVPDGFGQTLYLETAEAHLSVVFPEPKQAELLPNQIFEAELELANALRVILAPKNLDADTEYLVEAYSPFADIDLLVTQPLVYKFTGVPAALEVTELNYESTILKGDLLKTCQVHVYAHSGSINRQQVPIRVRVRPVGHASESLVQAPHWPVEPLALEARRERALQAAVAIFGNEASGSGSLISSTGLILTSAHVVPSPSTAVQPAAIPEEYARRTLRGHFAGFPTDLANAPMPEVGLQLLDYRTDLDLALLRIHSTLDGLPIDVPALNYVEINRVTPLELGAPLYSLGYPMTGGTGKFVSLTLGRGILAGRAQQLERASLKTDAPLHSGCSGGMLLNDDWQLVGVPDMNIQDSNGAGGIGFGIPVQEIPESWMRLIKSQDLEAVLAQLGGGRLVGHQALPGDDALALAQDLVLVDALLLGADTDYEGSSAASIQATEILRARLPFSLGAFHAAALHEPARATEFFGEARRIAGDLAAQLPAQDDRAGWAALWKQLKRDPKFWAELSAK